MNVEELATEYKQYVIDIRREIHRHPELSWQEVETSKRIKRELDVMGIPCISVGDPGLVATITGAGKGERRARCRSAPGGRCDCRCISHRDEPAVDREPRDRSNSAGSY